MNNSSKYQPDTYVLSIAISEYKYLDSIPNAVKDAKKITETLSERYSIKGVWELCDKEVTTNNIKRTFKVIESKIGVGDSLLILYNGHGKITENGETAYWQFTNSQRDEYTYKCSDIFDEILELKKVKDVALLINSCLSGNLFSSNGIMYGSDTGNRNSRLLFTSGTKYEKVRDSMQYLDFSPFANAIVEYLEKNDIYELPLINLISYTNSKFRENDYGSNPRYGHFGGHGGGDFILYLKEGREIIWQQTKDADTIEDYEYFLQKFPSGSYSIQANDRRNELVKERNAWADLLKDFHSNVEIFRHNAKNVSKQTTKDIELIYERLSKIKETTAIKTQHDEEWQKVREINNNRRIDNSKKIDTINKFLKKFPNTAYSPIANSMLDGLRVKEEVLSAWNSIIKDKGRSIKQVEHRKANIELFINQHKFTDYIQEANKKLDEVALYLEAEYLIEEGKDEKAHELLKQYERYYVKGDYSPRVKNRLRNIQIRKNAKEIESDFNMALESKDIPKIYQLVSKIEELKEEEEKKANETTLSKAKAKISNYERVRKGASDKAIASDSVFLMGEFISNYENCEHSKEDVEKVRNKLSDKEEESYNNAKENKDLEAFKYHRSQFAETSKVSARIKELEFYQSSNTKEHLKEYLKIYEENGLMVEEAQAQINSFSYDEQKSEAYTKAKNTESIELCNTYLEEYKSDKDQYYEEIKCKREELDREKRSNELFEQIKKTTGKDVLKLCGNFRSDFAESHLISEVQKIEANTKRDIEDDEYGEKAKSDKSIYGILSYLDKYGDKGRHSKELRKMLKRSDEKDSEKEALTKKYRRLVRGVIVIMIMVAISGGIMLFQYFKNSN